MSNDNAFNLIAFIRSFSSFPNIFLLLANNSNTIWQIYEWRFFLKTRATAGAMIFKISKFFVNEVNSKIKVSNDTSFCFKTSHYRKLLWELIGVLIHLIQISKILSIGIIADNPKYPSLSLDLLYFSSAINWLLFLLSFSTPVRSFELGSF